MMKFGIHNSASSRCSSIRHNDARRPWLIAQFNYCTIMNHKKTLSILFGFFLLLLGSCSPNNVNQDDSLKKYFDENNVTGCFALLDNGTGKFTVYNLKRYRDSTYLPASTFKIVNSLIGLQTGIISSDSMVIPWDGVKRRAEWDKDLNMIQAFQVSDVPYFQEVARRIGKDTMQYWLDTLQYGMNKKKQAYKISKIDTFWLDNSLKVTPDQNLGLVKKLFFHQLPFFKVNQEKVKNAMLMENNANYRLAYKTGWASTENKHPLGWVVGWIEENRHPYFFILNIESSNPNQDIGALRLSMLKSILKQYGFFEGKM
ncbi:MAG TPA: penicillin-binding transpeptidase domain-containing protein [Niabella sp.]|nr:penicillin-binding transpeptidase domain-containing protein [Niabella sp.]HOZ95446.1 penicillin-binding transpeptidase domain-containing protein [Niabella sp.]HQW14336.1 penicillin-binding transpeptidase domain-containing protein [Niabella sp.]HQX18385.1 penicillin-binding transpeptidase domain-containing protein [Niabella sp.]HQX40123.1 penicillin-binding transpeptidase domain-containing protein [Niabella sp.]